jgi:hypothetical protein
VQKAMNCAEVRRIIDGWSPDTEGRRLPEGVRQHLPGCQLCAEYCKDRVLSLMVRSVSCAPLSVDIEQRILGTLPPAQVAWWKHPSLLQFSALSAVVFACFYFLLPLRMASPPEPLSTVTLSVESAKNVRVMLNSKVALNDAKVQIGVPSNISIDGYPGVQRLTWLTDLKAGNNVIMLPLIMHKPLDGVIEITLEHNNAVKNLHIAVLASDDNAQQVRIL